LLAGQLSWEVGNIKHYSKGRILVVGNLETPQWQKIIQSQITAVTVYGDQALVTRKGKVSLVGGERELVIAPLPMTMETQSVRVQGIGTVGVRLKDVTCDRLYTTEPIAERVAQLVRQIHQIESQKRHLQAQIEALALQSSFITGLRDKTEETFAQSLARKNLSLSETLDFLNFLGSQYSEYAIASGDCKNQQQELDKQLQALRSSLQKLQTPHPKESFRLLVGVEVTGCREFELEISYMVHKASWQPLYDLRVDTNNKIIHLVYLAEITQTTGEDWLGVDLTLSTAKPGNSPLPPKLKPWYIDTVITPTRNTVQPGTDFQPAMALPMPMLANQRLIDGFATEFGELQPTLDMDVMAAEVAIAQLSRIGSVIAFKLESSGNIPSDGTPHKTTIFTDEYPCKFTHIAIPRLVSFAYLQANIINNVNGATLLPGAANIFRDQVFVGTTQLENILPGQEFNINLGIDEGLKVERDLVERNVDKKLMRNQKRITYAYRLIITNLLKEDVNLLLNEQLPVSRNEQLKVRLNCSNPPIQMREMGVLEWLLRIPNKEKQEIYYQFIVEHPSELKVIGLDI